MREFSQGAKFQMSNVQVEASYREIIFHHDDETPLQFVIELLHSVFKKQLADALRFTEAVRKEGKASCGSYPRRHRQRDAGGCPRTHRCSGHPLRITSRAAGADSELLDASCKLCGDIAAENQISLKGNLTLVCDECMTEIMGNMPDVVSNKQFDQACDAIARISPAFRRTSWSRPRGCSRATCARTFRWRSTGCSRRRRCGFSASMKSTATRR